MANRNATSIEAPESVSGSASVNTLGPLPENWRWATLREVVASVQYGLSKPMNSEGKGTPIIRMNNITYDGRMDVSELKHVPLDDEILAKYRLKKGDILFNRTNSKELVGKTAVFGLDGEFVFASYIIRVVLDASKALPEFVSSYLNSKAAKEILFRMARPAVQMANINAEELQRILVPLPPLQEQKRIVSKVRKFELKIVEAKRLRAGAQTDIDALERSWLNTLLLAAEQRAWKRVSIAQISSDIKSGFACSKKFEMDGGVPHLRPNNIGDNGELDFSRIVCIPAERVESSNYYLKKGDVLFNNTNSKELVGRAALVEQDLKHAFSNHITRMRIDTALARPEWVVLSLNHLWQGGHFLRICQKWIGQAGVNTKMLKETPIPLPSLSDQERIFEKFNDMRRLLNEVKEVQQKSGREVERLTHALLKNAFAGEL